MDMIVILHRITSKHVLHKLCLNVYECLSLMNHFGFFFNYFEGYCQIVIFVKMFVNGSFINHLMMVFLKCYFYELDAIFLFVLTVIMPLLCYNKIYFTLYSC
jgi:hypothetical protein